MSNRCDYCDGDRVDEVNEAGPPSLTGDFHVLDASIHNVICTRCGTVWNDRMDSKAALRRFYAVYEKKTGSTGEDDLLFDSSGGVETLGRHQVAFLARHVRQSASRRILDVGCGKGTLLTLFDESFPGWDRVGIEPSAAAADIARRSGVTVHEGMLDTVTIEDSSFDVVTIVHVLEHATSPVAALIAIHRALRPGGLLFIEVPNMLDPNMFYDFLLYEHLFHFSPGTLQRLALRQGFVIEALEPSTTYGATRLIARKKAPADELGDAYHVDVARLLAGVRSWQGLWRDMQQNAAALAEAAASGKRAALFGAGITAAALLVYTSLGSAPLAGLIDESPWKIGHTYFGLPVFSLADAARMNLDTIGVATIPRSHHVVRQKLAASFPSSTNIVVLANGTTF